MRPVGQFLYQYRHGTPPQPPEDSDEEGARLAEEFALSQGSKQISSDESSSGSSASSSSASDIDELNQSDTEEQYAEGQDESGMEESDRKD